MLTSLDVLYRPSFAAIHTTTCLDNTRHTSLDTRLSQSRNNHRRTLLRSSSEHREELCNPALGAICLFNQVHSTTPPSEQCRKHPEVCGYFDADSYTSSIGEETAGDCCANGKGEEEGCEDNVTGGCCDCLLKKSVSQKQQGGEGRLTPTQVKAAKTTNQDASSGK